MSRVYESTNEKQKIKQTSANQWEILLEKEEELIQIQQ